MSKHQDLQIFVLKLIEYEYFSATWSCGSLPRVKMSINWLSKIRVSQWVSVTTILVFNKGKILEKIWSGDTIVNANLIETKKRRAEKIIVYCYLYQLSQSSPCSHSQTRQNWSRCLSQQIRGFQAMSFWWWSRVADDGPTLKHRFFYGYVY